MIPMPHMPVENELNQLHQLAKRFAHWRQNRPSPKARIPKALWDEAASLTLTSNLSVSRVAKHLGLCTTDQKKHCPSPIPSPPLGTCAPPIHFVDVTPPAPWHAPAVEVDLKRADGAHLHLTDVVRAFLERV